METIATDHTLSLRALIDLSSEIARRGYGEAVVELALRRKGAPGDLARLVAISAIGCRRAILAAQARETGDHPAAATAPATNRADLRAARAANKALGKIVNFLVLLVAGFGVGTLLGWSVGFGHGVEDGFDWIVRALERLALGGR